MKKEVGSSYINLEKNYKRLFIFVLGYLALIPNKIKSKIKNADRKAAWIEATKIAGFNKKRQIKFLEPDEKILKKCKIILKNPLKSREEFLNIYQNLDQ